MAAVGIEAPEVAPWSWNQHSVLALFPVTRGERSRQRTRERYGEAAGVSPAGADLGAGQFVFDRVFGMEETNATLYEETMRDLVISSMEGKHCAAFAFGPTSTGKTFSMQGTAEHPGVIPRAVHDVFSYVGEHQTREFLLRASYLEVYNESINDLFEPASTNLRVFEDPKRGPQVQNLEEKIVVSPDQVFALISAGEAQRKVGCTDYNKQSSRSHTIFRLVIESKAKSEDGDTRGPARVATLNLVDLAGSESAQNVQSKMRRQEGSHINKSLLTLTNIIYKLSDGAATKGQHIPYRDSKLTRILQSSLQGNSRISIVCTCTPWEGAREETLSTLRFATRAKKVSRSVQVNEVLDERALLVQYKREIAELRQKLADAERRSAMEQDADAADAADAAGSASDSEPPSPAQTPPSPSAAPYARESAAKQAPQTPPSTTSSSRSPARSARSRSARLRDQIDAAIANLNRVILNSSQGPLSTGSRSRTASQVSEGESSLRASEPALAGEDGDSRNGGDNNEGDDGGSRSGYWDDAEHVKGQTPFFRRISSIDRDVGEDVSRERLLRSRSEGSAPEFGDGNVVISGESGVRQNLEARLRAMSDVASSGVSGEKPPLAPGVPASPASSSSRSRKRDTITSELRSIREQLANLLIGATTLDEDDGHGAEEEEGVEEEEGDEEAVQAKPEASREAAHGARAASPQGDLKEYVKQLEARVIELEGEVRKYALEQSVTRADRSFLQSMLKEKEATIAEWSTEIAAIEERQRELEEENQSLRQRVQAFEEVAAASGPSF
ncbi:Kinesin-related protein 11 [Hondaea fermentalgiana]|uniref:Kinesin-like protein n=1 Tax=Hondaea fermentalgiana TaxID=2315210 RepID=A0A2R5G581_9STRA|nr:Kinesin-related protein 11 [Hondaea fermentalgiana]|eukprot:GBG26186.1 Kinesin-related protein 11 [Hondaea fermentalgiana]